MSQDVADHLTFLYGADAAGPIEARLRQLIREHLAGGPPVTAEHPRRGLPLTQRDALLITYGDQVREAGPPPLQTLAEFLEEHAAGAVSGVHVLPFYPSSSDDHTRQRLRLTQKSSRPCGNTGGGAAGRYINPPRCAE